MRRQADTRTSGTQRAVPAAKLTERKEHAAGPEKARLAQESKAASAASPSGPSEDQIRKRAFEIYASGQHPSSDAVEIWLQAERELQNR